jgi:hypothetical protein
VGRALQRFLCGALPVAPRRAPPARRAAILCEQAAVRAALVAWALDNGFSIAASADD